MVDGTCKGIKEMTLDLALALTLPLPPAIALLCPYLLPLYLHAIMLSQLGTQALYSCTATCGNG